MFKKWAQAEPHPLRLTTEAAGGAWKMRESTKVKCAAAPPFARPRSPACLPTPPAPVTGTSALSWRRHPCRQTSTCTARGSCGWGSCSRAQASGTASFRRRSGPRSSRGARCPHPPPLLQPLVHMASPPLLPAPAIFLVRVGLDNIRTLYILAALQVCASACQSARAESARTRTRRGAWGSLGVRGRRRDSVGFCPSVARPLGALRRSLCLFSRYTI